MDRNKNTGEEKPYLCALNVQWEHFDLSTVKTIRIERSEQDKYRLKPNDLLVCEGGDVGRCAIWTSNDEMYYQNALHRVRCYAAIIPHFLLLVLRYYKEIGVLDDICKGVTIKHFTSQVFHSLPIPLPPIEEQKRIVMAMGDIIGVINTINRDKEQLLLTISVCNEKILDLAIHGKLVTQDPYDEPAIELLKRINPAFKPSDNLHYMGPIPPGWQVCHLGDIFEVIMGQSPDGNSLNKTDGIEFHQGKICFTEKYLSKSEVFTSAPTKFASPNSLLCCVRAPVGVFNITQRTICIGRGLCALSPRLDEVEPDYWFYALSSYRDYYESKSTGSTFKAISGDIIRNTIVVLPPILEEKSILNKITELFAILDQIANSINSSE